MLFVLSGARILAASFVKRPAWMVWKRYGTALPPPELAYEDNNDHRYEHEEDESDGVESCNTNDGPPDVNRQPATDFDDVIARGQFFSQDFNSVFREGEEFDDGGSLGSGFNSDERINDNGGLNDDVRDRIETNNKEKKRRGKKDKRNNNKGDSRGSSVAKSRDDSTARGECICRYWIDSSIPWYDNTRICYMVTATIIIF